ncbi:inner-membrane translocator (plasmid) [Ketogulonicigenium robustum]|uniref:Inner-membrane translocator n=1 Tax=Ketogulonicigenium robustum TaxID=92947 RepID=A0A1W6P3D2_9RHOB|nr:branched-chain amino acid ABC transporter permease [Ketogulonicigenium robustum]ARO16015.1 inner-membrane translocator [Ketogulonicigenium robustum]
MLSYLVFALITAGIYGILALSLNLIWGAAGMVNLGLVGFFAVGAYASALLTTLTGMPIWLGLICSMAVGALVGVAATSATLRLRGDYLAIVTLGFAEVVRLVALNERWLTKGADGISGIPRPFAGLLNPAQFQIFYMVLVLAIMIVAFLLLRRIDRSPFGRVLKAIREDQELASFAGKRIVRFKMIAFALSAALAGLAGGLYAHFQSYISPDHFQSLLTIYIFLAVTAGGVGRPAGAVLGAFLVVGFLEGARFIAHIIPGISAVQAASVREMMVGLALILILQFRAQGVLPEQRLPAPKR